MTDPLATTRPHCGRRKSRNCRPFRQIRRPHLRRVYLSFPHIPQPRANHQPTNNLQTNNTKQHTPRTNRTRSNPYHEATRPMSQIPVSNKKPRKRRPALTPWELPQLLTPLFTYKAKPAARAKARSYVAAVLGFVYRNRFAVSSQLRRRFPKTFSSDRTARRRLAEIQALGLLGVAPTRSTSPLWPKVYYVTGRGLKKLRRDLAARGTDWQPPVVDRAGRHKLEGYSSDRVVHELLTTELLLAVWQTVSQRPDLELLTVQRRALVRHPAFELRLKGKTSRLIPDGLFLFRQKGGGMVVSLVEMDTGEMNAKQVTTKLVRYEAWMKSESGQNYLVDLYREYGATHPQPSFRVLIVCEDRAATGGMNRMAELLRLALPFSNALVDKLWFTTVAELRVHQHDPLPLGASLWRRGKDARGWREDVAMASPASPKRERPSAAVRTLIHERMPTLALHPLFPHPPASLAP